MSRSGVAVSDECVTAFNELKLGKKLSYIIFGLDDKLTNVVVLKTSEEADYEAFLKDLPEGECRYAVYDFAYELASGEGKRNKIVFYSWSPDGAKIKAKMVYASSRESLRRALTGVATEIQGTDFDEVAYQTVLDKVSKGTK